MKKLILIVLVGYINTFANKEAPDLGVLYEISRVESILISTESYEQIQAYSNIQTIGAIPIGIVQIGSLGMQAQASSLHLVVQWVTHHQTNLS